jgi:hypothetical protein
MHEEVVLGFDVAARQQRDHFLDRGHGADGSTVS